MDLADSFWRYWYFHVPNYLLAVIGYTLLGRFALGLFVPPGWANYIWRAFVVLTGPALAATAAITPRFVHPILLPLVAAFWVAAARLGWWLALGAAGLAPTAAVTS